MEALKRYRQFRGFTRPELAKKIGISPETLARYERGDRDPTTTVIRKIATALNVTPNELLGIKNSEK